MIYTEEKLEELRSSIASRMSQARYSHTEGVADMAKKIGEVLLPELVSELQCAALLHDIAKETPTEELISILKKAGVALTEEDLLIPASLHSFAGPEIIKRDFPDFATENLLSAVRNHTTGDADMTVFDEIIFLSDYIELGRDYPSCVETRNLFLDSFSNEKSREDNINALHRAAYRALQLTEKSLLARGSKVHSKTQLAKNSLAALI